MTDTPGDSVAALLRRARVAAVDADGCTRVRLCGFSPVMTFLATVVVAVVPLAFAYPILAMVFNPRPVPSLLIVAEIAVVATLATGLALRTHARQSAGLTDLVLDHSARTVALPCNFGRRTPVVIPIDDVRDVAPAEEIPKTADGLDARALGPERYRRRAVVPESELPDFGHRGEAAYAVVVEWASPGAEVALAPIVRWSELRRVNAFAGWLRHRLGLG